ncbi:DUF4179 domain-containing protein [Clostridium intestinale]|uniref:DUF4179 domain-containing protein n=1 Tax=Clostridium intestinale DSM 6191 TaxID=1121320 RepID=A0A1M5ZQG4_9CLOT|nr:DUF4179 domain-containing protein [Clostridium intestinale]SHI26346.1 protein of unknown function [Clostridium intestinale DSM 6191]
MSSFDELIKNKINKEAWAVPKTLDDKLSEIIDELPSEPKSRNSISYRKIAAAAGVTLTILLAFNSSSVKAAVSNVIEYFNINKNSEYVGEASTFQEFNNSIGISAEDKGIKLTIDNIVADDNFLNIFYTAESEKDIPRSEYEDYWSAFELRPFLDLKVNGKNISGGSSYKDEAYLETNKILKGVYRANVVETKLTDKFNIEISTDRALKTEGNWKIEASVDKSKVVAVSKIVTPKKKVKIDNGVKINSIKIDKVAMSPLGNQIVITEYTDEDANSFQHFAIEDSRGNITTPLDHGSIGTDGNKMTNTFEFIGLDKETEYINIIPIKSYDGKGEYTEKIDIKKLPSTINLNDKGSITIDDVIFSKNQIKVKFRKNGVVLSTGDFYFYDKDGNELEFSKGGALEIPVDRSTGVYTTTYTSYNESEDFSKYAKIATNKPKNGIKLAEDQKIRVDLK